MEILNEYQENVLKSLVDLRKSANSPVFIEGFIQNALSGRIDYLTPELFDALCTLHVYGYISFFTSTGNIQGITHLSILPRGLNYFQDKERYLIENKKYNRNQMIWRIIPIIISIAALCVSIVSIIINIDN